MKKILVFAGTKDGRELIEKLLSKKYNISASVATQLGASYLLQYHNLIVHTGSMNQKEMMSYFIAEQFDIIIDASHPYAENVSVNIIQCCKDTGILYVRLERFTSEFSGTIIKVNCYEQAVNSLNRIKGNILITTGTNHLEEYKKIKDWQKRVVLRVLDQPVSIEKCLLAGFYPDFIIAENGPFSMEQNLEQIKKYNIKVLFTKDSGKTGGTQEKAEAADKASIPLVVLERPVIKYPNMFHTADEVLQFVEEALC